MTPSRPLQPRHVRYSVRHQARLDASKLAKLEELASTFHCERSAILRFVMQWGLRHSKEWTIDQSIPTRKFQLHQGGPKKNAENLLIIRDQALAAPYTHNWQAHAQHSQPYIGRGIRQ
jgi:hypothetical protein